MLYIPSELRGLFTRPFGSLFPEFSDILPNLKDRMVYTVGDVVTHSAFSFGILPAVGVIDGFTMCLPYLSMPEISHHILRVVNPAGTITDELVATLSDAVASSPCVIMVEGEEDLAVLPLIGLLPDGALVVYGQPNEGLVLCEVSPALRVRAGELLSCFVWK